MPTISVKRWERQYTPFFPKGYADEMYRYYFPLVNGYSLRNFISGKVYQRVTTNMRIARLIENSIDYCPSTRRTRILRLIVDVKDVLDAIWKYTRSPC